MILRDCVKVIRQGDSSGNGMLIRLTLSSGHEILGLPTENTYGGGWDLGPTWNYVVLDEKPFLVDTGKFGSADALLEMMTFAGISGRDIDFVMVSHGHEDHDGSLSEIAERTGAKVKCHDIYDRLIRFYPERAPDDARKSFPASCWRCFMPPSFSTEHCTEYQKARSRLKIETIGDDGSNLSENAVVYHVPGHSPDSMAVFVGSEAVLVGDTVLPDITPWPSQEAFFDQVQGILSPRYATAASVYGLRAYIRSLAKLKEVGKRQGDLIVLPAHRLFYNGRWNEIDLLTRIDELIAHHVQRCEAILKIVMKGAKTAKEIAMEYFDAPLLKGFGILMAENEVISHCELLSACGDVVSEGDEKFAATGTMNFESAIHSLEP
ncbi:MAG: MBL fold metallo-hydrolase [Desulfobacteraceae bacterium]|nr:MBL fold metallo-hydrolase [Desulfobacterales bacterium]MBL6966814.1 MBL fold metallo-hydrolase [Desulfobacteraceae bacterium]MBL7101545.1 MBL fold metallo-hydrolase [Desulfobacteraceae bacterium]MBL7172221.1 MBL fold metallo-hydrolase [Desulfobacteraceae bacterium]